MRGLLAVLSCSALAAPPMRAQATVADSNILVTVAKAVHVGLPSGPTVLDPRMVQTRSRSSGGNHSAEVLTALAPHFVGGQGTRDRIVVCGDTPDTCRLTRGVAVVAFSAPHVVGDTAYVSVRTTSITGIRRIPLSSRDMTYVLERREGRWHVLEVRITRMT